MSGRHWLIVGGMAAGVFWLLTRSAAAALPGRTIRNTEGQEFRLYQDGDQVRDQNGGLWL